MHPNSVLPSGHQSCMIWDAPYVDCVGSFLVMGLLLLWSSGCGLPLVQGYVPYVFPGLVLAHSLVELNSGRGDCRIGSLGSSVGAIS